jgi:hypothetical protein
MGPVRIEPKYTGSDKKVEFPCPFCMTSLEVHEDGACPDCESNYRIASIGENVVILTKRNASNPVI